MATTQKIRNDIAKTKEKITEQQNAFVRWRLSLRRKKIWKSSAW